MLLNREIKVLVVTIGVISLIGIIIGFKIDFTVGILVSLITFLLCSVFILFTWWRYKEIRKLSSYINKICQGDYSLEIRDNVEGELSILKSDIYKVTSKLYEQSDYLKKDKIYLADAISDISHQLKTPLTSMIIMTDLLNENNLEEDKKIEFTNNIKKQLERIQWLVTSLLKISKIDSGVVNFKKDIVRVSELIESVVNPLLIPIDIKNQRLNINVNDKLYFIGDFNWTREALINILKNAVEHTRENGEITIYCSDNPIYLEINIKDNGLGIEKDDIAHVFKRFYKGKNSNEDSIGIGLAMAKSIIKKQGGDILLKSKKGYGTEFIIRIYKQIV